MALILSQLILLIDPLNLENVILILDKFPQLEIKKYEI